MPRGFLSIRIDDDNDLHHLWLNNGSWWVHYTLHFANRKRRIRRSLKTSELRVAIARRDELLTRIQREGEEVPARRPRRDEKEDAMSLIFVAVA
jgi:ligand-binding sensor domain-containing protein